jgi:magnesium transporter
VAEAWHLSVDFVESHPAEAARVLESLPTAEASAFLASLPPPLGARALALMLPTAAARTLAALDDQAAHTLLHAASTPTAVAILRHLPESSRSRLVAQLPPASALASQLLLGFPDDTVGAWTDPDAPVVTADADVHAALEKVRANGTAGLQQLFVIDAERRLLGVVTLEDLARARDTDRLVGLIRAAEPTLAAMMPVASARDLSAWERASALPVVDHDRRLIGILRRAALSQALHARPRLAAETHATASATGALAASYWSIVAALSGATLALLPAVKRVQPEE